MLVWTGYPTDALNANPSSPPIHQRARISPSLLALSRTPASTFPHAYSPRNTPTGRTKGPKLVHNLLYRAPTPSLLQPLLALPRPIPALRIVPTRGKSLRRGRYSTRIEGWLRLPIEMRMMCFPRVEGLVPEEGEGEVREGNAAEDEDEREDLVVVSNPASCLPPTKPDTQQQIQRGKELTIAL